MENLPLDRRVHGLPEGSERSAGQVITDNNIKRLNRLTSRSNFFLKLFFHTGDRGTCAVLPK